MLHDSFLASAAAHPDRPAVITDQETVTYDELCRQALSLAAILHGERVAVFSTRGVLSHRAMLACSFAGVTYVPLNPAAPPERLRRILDVASPDLVLCDDSGTATARALSGTPILTEADIPAAAPISPRTAADLPAYLMFTSGTTGQPKGVPIEHHRVDAFVQVLRSRWDFAPEDVFAQAIDPAFDLSMVPTWGAWVAGSACRLVDPTALLLRPGALAETGATVWTSTPSLANLLLRRGAGAKDALRGLRWSFFCGEPLTRHTARTWQGATNGRIDNIYGPTEATVVVFGHEVRPDDNPNDDVNAVVPIGRPFPGVQTDITADGELLIAGTQVFGGYYGEPPRTWPWYHTGDRVAARADGNLSFLGRIDDQVKVLGHRVELGEIEAAVRDTGQAHEVAAIAWPLVDGVAQSITLFVANEVRLPQLYAALGERLPKALLPKQVIQVDTLPLTGNGKVDRRALREML